MSELQEMQSRIAQLEQETLSLKSKGKAQAMRQRFVFGLAVVGVGLALMSQKGNTQAGERPALVVRDLKVVDAADETVLHLTSTPDFEGKITIYNSGKKPVMTLSATKETGDGRIWVYDAEGQTMAQVGSDGGVGQVWTKK